MKQFRYQWQLCGAGSADVVVFDSQSNRIIYLRNWQSNKVPIPPDERTYNEPEGESPIYDRALASKGPDQIVMDTSDAQSLMQAISFVVMLGCNWLRGPTVASGGPATLTKPAGAA